MTAAPPNPPQGTAFIAHLRDEKIRAQQMRADYTMRKLAFVTALLGLGSINLGGAGAPGLDLTPLLFLVPWVSIAFDLYIMGEDYGIKRIGQFLRGITKDPAELQWERWVSQKRDWFAPLAMPLLTSLLLFGAALILNWRGAAAQGFGVWLVGTLAATWLLYGLYLARRKSVDQSMLAHPGQTDLPPAWQEIRREVRAADHTLTPAVFERICQAFLHTYASGKETPAALTRGEYDKEEFLLVLDEHGHAAHLPSGTMERFRQTAERHPVFGQWFQAVPFPEGGRVLLAARWLCHLTGLLHGTVEIFIDPPDRPGFTLVQVRGMDKVEAPGAFDIPCAGHVSGLDQADEALGKELAEELDLFTNNLSDIRLISRYNSISADDQGWAVNNEHRILYRANLKKEAVAGIRFADGEVAGLGMINVAELRRLVQQYPERIATGLSDSIGYYEE